MNKLSDNLRSARRAKGLSQSDLAKISRVSQSTISDIERERNKDSKELPRLAAALGTTVEALLTGISFTSLGVRESGGQYKYNGPERRSLSGTMPIFAWDAPEDLPPDQYVIVPRVDVRFSAGSGEMNFEEVRKDKGNAYRHDWIRSKGLNPKKLIAVYVKGDSMEPTLPDGSIVTLDISKTSIEEGKVYGLRYGDELRIKRLKKRFDGSLIIQSDNPKYSEEIVPRDQLEHITVIGRYVGHCYDGDI